MERIRGYIHVAAIGNNWSNLLDNQINLIRRTGLESLCERIFLCKSGIQKSDKYNWHKETESLLEFELPTLELLYDHALEDPSGVCFYIHLKGVSKTDDHWTEHKNFYKGFAGLNSLPELTAREGLWRSYMEYFVIEKYQDCLLSINENDTCGVEWRERPFPHYSGNFWWARNSYINRLKRPSSFFQEMINYKDGMGSNRASMEFWLGSGKPKAGVLHNFGWNLYHKEAFPHLYRSRYKIL